MHQHNINKGVNVSQIFKQTLQDRSSISYQRKLVDWIGEQHLSIQQLDDWYRVAGKQLHSLGLGSTLQQFWHSSHSHMLSNLYPEHLWLMWKFDKAPSLFWHSVSNQRQYLEWLKTSYFHINNWEDWYDVSLDKLAEVGAAGLLDVYSSSRAYLLTSVFPEYKWSRFIHISTMSEIINQQRQFLDKLTQKLNITNYEEWYNVSLSDIEWYGGRSLFKDVFNSRLLVFQSGIPEYDWSAVRCGKPSTGMWQQKKDDRFILKWVAVEELLNRVAEKMHITNWDDWYFVPPSQIYNEVDGYLLSEKFRGSLFHMLTTAYPHHPWLQNIQQYFDFIISEQSLQGPEQLAEILVPLFHSIDKDGNSIIGDTTSDQYQLDERNQQQQRQALKEAYPEIDWEVIFSNTDNELTESNTSPLVGTSNSEGKLVTALCQLLPDVQLLQNYRHPDLIHSTGTAMELDVYCPSFNIAFEYQGGEHYHNYYMGSLEGQRRRDDEKYKGCQRVDITLIHIPFWWNNSVQTLAGTIHHYRPDIPLQLHTGLSDISLTRIPDIPPQFERDRNIADQNPAGVFVRIHPFAEYMDPTNNIITEFFNGYRAIWTGNSFVLQGRGAYPQSKRLVPPEWFHQQLPQNLYTDGHLWCGYGQTQQLHSIIEKEKLHESDWKQIKFIIFDSPDHTVRHLAYLQRVKFIKDILQQQQQHYHHHQQSHFERTVQVVETHVCKGLDDMYNSLSCVVQHGGEGILIHDHHHPYLPGFPVTWKKNNYYLGLAKVIRIEQGVVTCESSQGIPFEVQLPTQCSDILTRLTHILSESKVPVITYKYYGLSLTRQPVLAYCQKVHNVSWKQISPFIIQIQNQSKSSCAVCRAKIPLQQLCVKVESIYRFKSKGYLTIPVSFCLKTECLKGIRKHRKLHKAVHTYPKFRKMLSISDINNGAWTTRLQRKQYEEFKNACENSMTILANVVL